MFAVEVQDAQGRVVPVTDNEVAFQVSGEAKLIGVGNGDPTDQQSDKGTSRKAFSGLCMAIVQSTKSAGDLTVEATSPGLAPAHVTIATKAVELRPQIPVWKREIPVGEGVTGLWRPALEAANSNELVAMLVGGGTMVFTLRQSGNTLKGTVESGSGGFFGSSDRPVPITDGKVEGSQISFTAGTSTYTGTMDGEQLKLQRKLKLPWHFGQPAEPTGPRPAIGPPPDGTDPSFNRSWRMPESIPVVLHRVKR